MKKIVYVFALCAMFMTSCSNNEEVVNLLETEDLIKDADDQDDLTKNLKFMPLTEQLSLAEKDLSFPDNIRKAPSNGKGITIFKARIARKKYNCEKGFGLCDIIILGKRIDDMAKVEKEMALDPSIYYTIVNTDSIKGNYVDFFLANDPNLEKLSVMPDFVIDEEIEKGCIIDDSLRTYTVASGALKYEEKVGPHGGFRLNINEVENHE